MALPTTYTPPKDAAELERRRVLAEQLKEFAQTREGSPFTDEALKNDKYAEDLVWEGAGIDVSRDQISNLFDRYKKERTPTGTPTPMGTPTPAGTPATTPAERQISTPGLDRLAALQNAPMGSVSSRGPRSLESESGKALRAARKLQRMGFEGAANQIALTGGVRSLTEPKIKTQQFRTLEQQGQEAATAEAAELETERQQQRTLNKRLFALQNKALDEGTYNFSQFGAPKTTQ